jgi:tetratricopeptide (TPR) repeat protein
MKTTSTIQFFTHRVMMAILGIAMLAALAPRAVAATPEAEALYAQGMTAYQQEALIRAADLFKKATEKDAAYVDAWFNLGAVNFKMNKFEQSRYAFHKALWRAPSDHEVRYNLALAQAKLGMNDEAIKNLERIPTTSGNFKDAAEQIAMLKQKGGVSSSSVASHPASTSTASTATATNINVDASGVYAKGLVGPTGLAVGPAGELYVANYTKNSIVKIMPNGSSTTLVQNGPINGPIGMVRDPRNGNLYIANYISGDIVTIAPNGATNTLKRGYGKPYYLYFDALTNRLFVSEQEGNRVSVLKL